MGGWVTEMRRASVGLRVIYSTLATKQTTLQAPVPYSHSYRFRMHISTCTFMWFIMYIVSLTFPPRQLLGSSKRGSLVNTTAHLPQGPFVKRGPLPLASCCSHPKPSPRKSTPDLSAQRALPQSLSHGAGSGISVSLLRLRLNLEVQDTKV